MFSYLFTYVLAKIFGTRKTVNGVAFDLQRAKTRAINDLGAVLEQRTLQAAALTDLIAELAEERSLVKSEAERAGELSDQLLAE